ncbi:MAG: hypothetical protein PF495_12230, partial [Spirochaetales bacterium]|nr:hypothetical protein [Spirochaetales bacterium]
DILTHNPSVARLLCGRIVVKFKPVDSNAAQFESASSDNEEGFTDAGKYEILLRFKGVLRMQGFGYVIIAGCLFFPGVYLFRKVLYMLDASGKIPLYPEKRFCEVRTDFKGTDETLELILNGLKRLRFSVREREGMYICFSSPLCLHPIRIELQQDKERVRLLLTDAHCQMTISTYREKKYKETIDRVLEQIKASVQNPADD